MTPLQSETGLGHMVVLRMPSPQLAILAQDKLCTVRDKIGFQYRFEVLLCSSEQEITLDTYFLKRLQVGTLGLTPIIAQLELLMQPARPPEEK